MLLLKMQKNGPEYKRGYEKQKKKKSSTALTFFAWQIREL